MAAMALASYAVYLGLAFGLRTAMQLRRSGDSGFRGVGGAVGSAEWIAGVLFAPRWLSALQHLPWRS